MPITAQQSFDSKFHMMEDSTPNKQLHMLLCFVLKRNQKSRGAATKLSQVQGLGQEKHSLKVSVLFDTPFPCRFCKMQLLK